MLDSQAVVRNVTALAQRFQENWQERQLRSELAPDDFDALRQAGFHLLSVPVDQGGAWVSAAQSTRPLCESLRLLAQADSSLALVASMHPGVVCFWLNTVDAPSPFQQAWRQQRREVFQSVLAGAFWGTITSEAGSGGDILKSKAVARRAGGNGAYRLTGQKQFGSGLGIVSNMITTAVPEGEREPDFFFMHLRDVAWDGSAGIKLAAPWDGHGMCATQSHAMSFEDYPATRVAIEGRPLELMQAAGATIQCLFAAVITGIVERALDTARARLKERKASLLPFEQTEWARFECEGWLLQQAFEAMLRAVEEKELPRRDVLQGKLAVAELAESVMTRICRVVGGGTFSRHSPFGFWFEDVRALGFLRPPWALGYQSLLELL
ncbi:MAG: hypothetical protein IIA40_06905 [SAR324 cluster bacterium]|nr:hypothetical protein [SAR324 cluster bacterium]